jgi:hypothetical protein
MENFVNNGKINVEALEELTAKLVEDAAKSNEEKFGQLTAARRFRTNSIKLEKVMKKMRAVTPKMK